MLAILNQPEASQHSLRDVAEVIQRTMGIEAVGVRLKDGDDFPYQETFGFPARFVAMERYLCAREAAGNPLRDRGDNPILECMCGNVLCGRTDRKLPFFTDGGSFWTNSTTELLASTTEVDRQAPTRNRCHGEGYESVALVPIRAGAEILGLLQLNDHRRDRFTPGLIRSIEVLGASIGIALARKQAREALLASDSLVRGILSNVQDAFVRADRDDRIVMVSPSAVSLFGYGSSQEMLGLPAEVLFQSDEAERSLVAELQQQGSARDRIEMGRRQDGTRFWVSVNARLCHDEQGQVLGAECFVRDITERKCAEHALEASENRYRRLFEAAKDGILILDVETGRIVDVNPFLGELTGFSREEMLGKELWEIGSFRDIAASRDAFAALRSNHYVRYEDLPLETRDGRRIDVEFISNLYRADDRDVIQCNIRDITERKRAESELAVLARFPEESPSPVLRVSGDGTLLYANPSADTLLRAWGCALGQRPPAAWVKVVADAMVTGERYEAEADCGGRSYWLCVCPIQRAGYVNVYGMEITARKRAETALQQSEKKYRDLFENAVDAILIADAETGVIWDANRGAATLLGRAKHELVGLSWSELCPADETTRYQEEFGRHVTLGRVAEEESKVVKQDGTVVSVRVSAQVIDLEGKRVVQGIIRDITEQKRAEEERTKLAEQLRLSQKMDAIGTLAGGVAHDFNNLLSVILSCTEFALDGVSEDEALRADLLEVKKAADSAAVLTRQLLAFGRRQVMQPVPLDLNMATSGLEKMLRRVLGEDIDFALVLAGDLGLTLADPGQVEQVLMNLVVNARDAMPEGGKLTIETSNVEIDQDDAGSRIGVKAGSYVRLAVTDNGCGMDESTKAKIFEPFFTTKETGKGTGLGLSTVYGVVKQSGGNVWVYSELGRGTTIKVHLPRWFGATSAAITTPQTAQIPSTGDETILMVEDEEALRRIAVRTLDGAGYTTLVAANGEEALFAASHHQGDIHLLLTDVVMPRMGGRVLARELSKQRPSLKVVFMSGYADDAMVHHGVFDAGTHFLAKPFTSTDLKRKIREVLDGGVVRPEGGFPSVIAEDAQEPTPVLDERAFCALSPNLADQLRKAVTAARYDEIGELVESIRTTHPAVATVFRRLADEFDYDGMRKLLRPGTEHRHGG